MSSSTGEISKYIYDSKKGWIKNKTIKVPTYAEEIYLTDKNNLYVLFESCSNRYKNQASYVENRVVLLDL